MVWFSKRAQTWCFAAYLAASSVIAPALHNHSLGCCNFSPPRSDRTATDAAGERHDHDHPHSGESSNEVATHSHAAGDATELLESHPAVASESRSDGHVDCDHFHPSLPCDGGGGTFPGDDCLACKLLVQGQLLPKQVLTAGEYTSPPALVWTQTLRWPIAIRLHYGARAPPVLG
jgi:hypothetical protein